MIISASRRTDIPAFYSDWLVNRMKEGYLLVRNPINKHQISKIILSHDTIDGFVFWTKNPLPMLHNLQYFKDYPYYFQFTLNPYDNDIERYLPKKDILIDAFKKLSEKIGKDKIIWRYDPIILTDKYNINYHIDQFGELAKVLSPYTRTCTFSYLDRYRKTDKNMKGITLEEINEDKQLELAKAFADIADSLHIELNTCSEEIDLSQYGITHAHCIDKHRLEMISGKKLKLNKDKNQRPECGCYESIDIGSYNTCSHGCLYCYATYDDKRVKDNLKTHDINSPILSGTITAQDKITERKIKSCIIS